MLQRLSHILLIFVLLCSTPALTAYSAGAQPAAVMGLKDQTNAETGRHIPALYCPEGGALFLAGENNAAFASARVEQTGVSGSLPVHGDWNADGQTDWGIYDQEGRRFLLHLPTGPRTIRFSCGDGLPVPLAGDWNHDGIETVGLYQPDERRFCLKNSHDEGDADIVFTADSVPPGGMPLSGRWTTAPGASVGIYYSKRGLLVLFSEPKSDAVTLAVQQTQEQPHAALAAAGDWDGDGIDSAAFYRPRERTFCVHEDREPLKVRYCLPVPPRAHDCSAPLQPAGLRFGAPAALPQAPVLCGPAVCSGYNVQWRVWGRAGNCGRDVRISACPPNHALSETDNARSIGTVCGSCCPLPAPNVLLPEHLYARQGCPPGYLPTGSQGSVDYDAQAASGLLRCTKVNPRYRVGAPSPAMYYGYGFSAAREFVRQTVRSRIPAALRWGLGRTSREQLDEDGCIGSPWGSVLVQPGGNCAGAAFAQLQYAGLPGDPASGTALVMYPECAGLARVFEPDVECLP